LDSGIDTDHAVPAGALAARRTPDVAAALIELIGREGIGAGGRLPPEIELARRLGVGRSTIRETLRAWQDTGIVTRNKGAGTTLMVDVTRSVQVPLTLRLEAESLLRTQGVRRPLEIEASRLAARNATAAQRAAILRLGDALARVHAEGGDWRPADDAFHAAIHEASGNPLFGQLIIQIQKAFRRVYAAPLGEPQLGARSIPMHRDLADAIAAGNPDRAVRAVSEIMDIVETETRAVTDAAHV
jgi:GntR family transcriptional repressor for pyruvate dehydrogenase complex